jgi:LPS O-antigen subunit length determinant protein (WzzB/FepE family)
MSLDERFVMSDWMKPRDLSIEETLAFSQRVTADTKVVKPAAVVPKTYEQKPVTATLTEKPDMERAAIQRRVMNFKAHQDRFQREREEYYATTMAKARATQWNSAGDKNG